MYTEMKFNQIESLVGKKTLLSCTCMTLSTLYNSTEKLWRSCIIERHLDYVTNKQTRMLSVLRLKCTLQKCRLLFAPISGSLNHMEGPQQNVKYMYIVFSPTYIQGFRSLISAKVSMFHCRQKNCIHMEFQVHIPLPY